MTATDAALPVCPGCGSANTIRFADGQARCFDCDTEWDPAQITGIGARAPAPAPAAAPEPGHLLPDDEHWRDARAADADLAHDLEAVADDANAQAQILEQELIGASVVLEGGQMATIKAFPDLDHATVILSDLSEVDVPLGDIERSIVRHGARADDPADVPAPTITVSPDDAFMLSGLIIRMGIAAIVDGPDGDQVGPPPAGWLPYSPEVNALVEAASAVAVARLIIAYEIPVDDLLEGLDTPGAAS